MIGRGGGTGALRAVNLSVIVPISGIHRGVFNALQYARSIAPENVSAVYVDFDEEATALLRTWIEEDLAKK